jgi:hypothetical protein
MQCIGIYEWGVVAPKSPNIETFEKNLEKVISWLEPFEGFGPNNSTSGGLFRVRDILEIGNQCHLTQPSQSGCSGRYRPAATPE